MNHHLAADPIDVVAALAAQHPGHGRERAGIDLLAVVLVGADVAVLAERASHVAGSKKDRAGPGRAAIEQLLAGVMKMCAHSRAGGELAGAELDAGAAIDAAIPRAEIAMAEHAVGELAAELQQARAVRRLGQRFAFPDRLPTREEAGGQALEPRPQRLLARGRGVETRGNRGGDAELGRPPVLRNLEIPGERGTNNRIAPNLRRSNWPMFELLIGESTPGRSAYPGGPSQSNRR
jgi:hypothetical protein